MNGLMAELDTIETPKTALGGRNSLLLYLFIFHFLYHIFKNAVFVDLDIFSKVFLSSYSVATLVVVVTFCCCF